MSSDKLNTHNPESLYYSNQVLTLTVLGGVKLEGLDRMRVTLKAALHNSPRPAVRHNLDLYNDTQLEKFIRKLAERLEVGTSVLAATLSELTESLEDYRLKEIEKQKRFEVKTRHLSEEEREEAESFLKAPKLMERTNALIGESGVVGEEVNRLIMYVIFTSRKREQPLHIISLGASGIGKTHLQEKVGELIPKEDKVEITTLSENAFYYFGQRELKNKLILIEDLDGAENVLYPLRELQSKKRISKTIAHKNSRGETRTIHLVVEGPVSVSGCTTREEVYEDNANRSFLIYLDESKAQDEKIMDYQRRLSARKVDTDREEEIRELLRNSQRILEPVMVVNPFAELLTIPQEVLKPRRTNKHYLEFIQAVTFYHQKQREQKVDKETGEVYIETTLEDIEEANKLLKEILLRKSDELSGACRNYFESLKIYLIGEKQKSFTNRQMSLKLKIPVTTIKRYHLDLYNSGYLKITKKDKYKGYQYEIVSYEEYKRLRDGISGVLDGALEKVKKILSDPTRPNSPVVAQKKSGPVNGKETSSLSAQPTKTEKKVIRR